MRYYIATKLENHAEHNRLRDLLDARGHCITYDWTFHGPVFRDGLNRIREVAILEAMGTMNAEVVIMLWPGGRGTHVELGMAIASGSQVHIISDVEGHHEASSETCAFYHHPAVKMHRSIDELLEFLETF